MCRAASAMMCSREVKNLSDSHHALFANGFADHGKCLLPDFPVRHDVVGTIEIKFIYLVLGDKFIDVDHALTLDRDCFQLFGIKLDIFALADLVALNNVSRLDFISALGIDLAVLDRVAGVLIELVETDLLPL